MSKDEIERQARAHYGFPQSAADALRRGDVPRPYLTTTPRQHYEDQAKLALFDELVALLRDARQQHHYCEDGWYSCPRATDGCFDPRAGSECNCGADAWNTRIAALLAKVPQ